MADPTRVLKVVNNVIDTLDLRVSVNAPPTTWLFSQITSWRKHRDEWEPGSESLLIEIPALGTFRLLGSQKPYEFVLVNSQICDIRIWKPESWDKAVQGKTGQLFIGFRSKFLQLVGIDAVKEVVDRISAMFIDVEGAPLIQVDSRNPRPNFVRVARGDLAVDVWQDRGFLLRDLDHMVCQSYRSDVFNTLSDVSRKALLERVLHGQNEDTPPMDNKGVCFRMPDPGPAELAAATVLDAFTEAVADELEEGRRGAKVSRLVLSGRQPQTIYFGRWSSPIHCKAYNKLASLKVQKKLYMLDEWIRNGWDGTGHVWRWEWTFTGDFLKSVYVGDDRCDIRDLDSFLEFIPALWHYVSRNWLRQIRNANARKNTEKVEITLYWAVIQSAWDGVVGVTRDHSREIRIKDESDKHRKILELEAQARGCMTTAAALRRSKRADIDVTTQADKLEKQARGCLVSAQALRLHGVDHIHEDGQMVDVETGEVYDLAAQLQTQIKMWVADDLDIDVWIRGREIGHDDLSDSAITSLYRSYRLAEGFGS